MAAGGFHADGVARHHPCKARAQHGVKARHVEAALIVEEVVMARRCGAIVY